MIYYQPIISFPYHMLHYIHFRHATHKHRQRPKEKETLNITDVKVSARTQMNIFVYCCLLEAEAIGKESNGGRPVREDLLDLDLASEDVKDVVHVTVVVDDRGN